MALVWDKCDNALNAIMDATAQTGGLLGAIRQVKNTSAHAAAAAAVSAARAVDNAAELAEAEAAERAAAARAAAARAAAAKVEAVISAAVLAINAAHDNICAAMDGYREAEA